MPIAAEEQNRAALAIANAATTTWRFAAPTPRRPGTIRSRPPQSANQPGRVNADPAGQVKNLATVNFAPSALVEDATHFLIMSAGVGGDVRAWGRLVDADGNDTSVSQATTDDILRIPVGGIIVSIPSGA